MPEGWPLPGGYDVVACGACGFVYADTPARQADYDMLYRELSKYEESATATGGGESALDRARLEDTARTISGLVADPTTPVLDVGCGNGGLLGALAVLGHRDLTGLDPSPACAERVRSRGFRAMRGTLTALDEETARMLDGRFGVVAMSHVLEHLCDLRDAVRRAVSFLAPDGLLYVEVPDAAAYADHPFVPFYYFDGEHINHFDEHALRNLARVLGLEVIAGASKAFEVAGGRSYPAVWAAMRRGDAGPEPAVPNGRSRASVEQFVTRSLEEDSWPGLERLAESQEPVMVWGAGSFAQRMMSTSPLGRCAVIGFVDLDSKKHGSTLGGVSVSSPDSLEGFPGTVVICAALQGDEIEAELRRRGLRNPTLRLDGERRCRRASSSVW